MIPFHPPAHLDRDSVLRGLRGVGGMEYRQSVTR